MLSSLLLHYSPPLNRMKATIRGVLSLASVFLLVGCAALVSCRAPRSPVVHPQGPTWRDVPVETWDYGRMWRTTIDVLSERFALEVLDREGGYLRTDWRRNELEGWPRGWYQRTRLTAKLFPDQGRIRLGIEVEIVGLESARSQEPEEEDYRSIVQELQARLREVGNSE